MRYRSSSCVNSERLIRSDGSRIKDCSSSKHHGSILFSINDQQGHIDQEERSRRQQRQDSHAYVLSGSTCKESLIMDRLHPRSRLHPYHGRTSNQISSLPCLDCTIKCYIQSCGHLQAYTSLCQRARQNVRYGRGLPAGCGVGMRIANPNSPERGNGECTGCQRMEKAEKEALVELEREFGGLWKVTGNRKREDSDKDEDEDGAGLVG